MPDKPKVEEPTDEASAYLEASLSQKHENYLGDVSVVDAIVRMFIWSCLNRRKLVTVNEDASAQDLQDCLRTASIFLGQDPNYTPMKGWNEPGHIDTFIAERLNVSGETPQEVVAGLFTKLLCDIYDLVNYSVQPDTLPEQWTFQVDGIVETYVWILMGARPPKKEMELIRA